MRDSNFFNSDSEFNAVRTALDRGINRKDESFFGSIFDTIGGALKSFFSFLMNMFTGAGQGKDFNELAANGDGGYSSMSKTGKQMHATLKAIHAMSPEEMGYSDPQTKVTGKDLVEARAHRQEVMRAANDPILRDRNDPKAPRRTPNPEEVEAAKQRLEDAKQRSDAFNQEFKQRHGITVETAVERFQERKQEIMYATAEQLGIEARANGLKDTPSARELLDFFYNKTPPASLHPDRLRNTPSEERGNTRQSSQELSLGTTPTKELSIGTCNEQTNGTHVSPNPTPRVQRGSSSELSIGG
ncbi:MAG: hypothetical protein EAY65_02230 [Alphaproteobacteria bacterium]|nr:MAG: hypothetical protein EAY65_02230 [Alphaproteobacteria bacterium]